MRCDDDGRRRHVIVVVGCVCVNQVERVEICALRPPGG